MKAIIASAAYVGAELAAEFGHIPPAFLPVGNRRLYTLQVDALANLCTDIYLTVPASYEPREADLEVLGRYGVHLLALPDDLSLGESISTAIDQAGIDSQFSILYGDTLIPGVIGKPSSDLDQIYVSRTHENYPWHFVELAGERRSLAWVGLFQFSAPAQLQARIEESGGNFIAAVEAYCRQSAKINFIEVQDWLDFGHVHTYFESKRLITTQRAFNELSINGGVVTKRSFNAEKMRAEANWFQTVPPELRIYVPNFIQETSGTPAGYQLEYLPMCSLSELFVFGELPIAVWQSIFTSCNAFLEAAGGSSASGDWTALDDRLLYYDKTIERLAAFSEQAEMPLDAPLSFNGVEVGPLRHIVDDVFARLAATNGGRRSLVHGDFCFSNILFDFRSRRIKVIDPRGLDHNGCLSNEGDVRYDIAKLAHSVVGKYDLIIAGNYTLQVTGLALEFHLQDEHLNGIQARFEEFLFAGRKPSDWGCAEVQVLLFLSMLPLHADQPRRQLAFLANALRLYLRLSQ